MNTIEISLFPIPDSVSLPFTTVPLHVFEPRYRKMISDSISHKRRIGVAHTKRIVSESKTSSSASLEQQLSSNQDSYEAHTIFSAGFAEMVEALPDGRMIIKINMDRRYEIIEERQQVPYRIVLCSPYDDEPEDADSIRRLRADLDQILILVLNIPAPELCEYVRSDQWLALDTEQYSYLIYSVVLLESETLQEVLEMRSPFRRIQFLKDLLT